MGNSSCLPGWGHRETRPPSGSAVRDETYLETAMAGRRRFGSPRERRAARLRRYSFQRAEAAQAQAAEQRGAVGAARGVPARALGHLSRRLAELLPAEAAEQGSKTAARAVAVRPHDFKPSAPSPALC